MINILLGFIIGEVAMNYILLWKCWSKIEEIQKTLEENK